MPAPPEFGDGGGDVGVVEVLGEIESQHLAHANAHHGVAGKIKVELERVAMTPSQTSAVEALASPTNVVEGLSAMPMMSVQRAPMVSASRTFFGEAECEQGHAILDLLEVVAAMSHMQLGPPRPGYLTMGPR